MGSTVLPRRNTIDVSSQRLASQLHTIANTKDRNSHTENVRMATRGPFFVDTSWATRENQSAGRTAANLFQANIVTDNFTVDVLLTYPSSNQLRVLRTEIEYQYAFLRETGLLGGQRIGKRRHRRHPCARPENKKPPGLRAEYEIAIGHPPHVPVTNRRPAGGSIIRSSRTT